MKHILFILLSLCTMGVAATIGSHGTNGVFDIGSHEAVSGAEPPVPHCADSVNSFDTVRTWNNAIAVQCSVFSDSGVKLYLRYGEDSTSSSMDSTEANSGSQLVLDTIINLNPSTRYWVAFVDSCGTVSTGFDSVWTDDSTILIVDNTGEGGEPTITSISPSSGRGGSQIRLIGSSLSPVDSVLLNSVKCTIDSTKADTCFARSPVWAPRGYYTPKFYSSGGIDSIVHGYRIKEPTFGTSAIITGGR